MQRTRTVSENNMTPWVASSESAGPPSRMRSYGESFATSVASYIWMARPKKSEKLYCIIE